MRIVDRVLDIVGSVLPTVLLVVVLVVVTANIVARTALGIPFHAAHDLALVAFAGVVWFGLVGAAINGQMFGVNFLVDKLPPALRRVIMILSRLIVIAIALAVIRASWAQIETARFTRFLALGWPKWIVSAGLMMSMVMIIVVQAREAIELLRSPAGRDNQ